MISLWLGNQWDICCNVQPRNNVPSSKGNQKEGWVLSVPSRVFRMGFKKIFCISKTSWVCALSYGAEVDVFRNWLLGLEEHWGFLCPDLMKEPCLGLLFRSVNCLLGWLCPILFGEQELEAVQPLGCLAGGWGWCSLWAPILGRQTPLHMVTLWWFVLLAFFFHPLKPMEIVLGPRLLSFKCICNTFQFSYPGCSLQSLQLSKTAVLWEAAEKGWITVYISLYCKDSPCKI